MKDVIIKPIEVKTKLFKQPYRIGDILEDKGKKWVIIGIQNVSIIYNMLKICYICQDLNAEVIYPYTWRRKENNDEMEFIIRLKMGDDDRRWENIGFGMLFWHEGMPYRMVDYTDVEIEYTDVLVSVLTRPIRPLSREELRRKRIQEKKKGLNLGVVEYDSRKGK